MSLIEQFNLSDNWQYVIAGIVCYMSARFFYSILGCKFDQIFGNRRGNDDEIDRSDPKYKDDSPDEDIDGKELDYQPFWPAKLEHVPLEYTKTSLDEMLKRSREFYTLMNSRRTVRNFSSEPVPAEIIRNIIQTAGTAPSGAHTEPWTFVAVFNDDLKSQIRNIIENEEEVNYMKRMGKKWTADLQFLRTNWVKEYLTEAPCLICIFKQTYSILPDGNKRMHYYSEMSINIAAGMLLTAIHYAGLVSVTSTPLNCGPQLRSILNRPLNEKLVLLLPVGFPAENCLVPKLSRKELDEILVEL